MCHFQKGVKNDVAFVFSCPGAAEEAANRPAAGRTGTNLHQLLFILNSHFREVTEWSREAITITNAWSKVEYRQLTGRTEATIKEVLSEENLSRLEQELNGVEKVIICSGQRATLAVNTLANTARLREGVKVISIRHLGLRSLNQIKVDINGRPIYSVAEQLTRDGITSPQLGLENTKKRLEVVAHEIINVLQ
ncbi:hypothetical protein AB3N04_13185 [Alkalihalophilus sp. As8PL]|uniref:Uncharacterized protein n=1 Tax=Alkalihalophilus sp. As8PL TaxID=3237103 RepID=A0AB39BQ72_9BACI